VPRLVEIAPRRASAEDLTVDFQEGDAESLTFINDSYDAVLSAISVMFTADHARAAGELLPVVRPGGRVGLARWTPTGFVGQILDTVSRHAHRRRWPGRRGRGTEETLRELFSAHTAEISLVTESVTQRFARRPRSPTSSSTTTAPPTWRPGGCPARAVRFCGTI
jgi:SAM-dependent methyltransferase